jgi:hypothetical protein
LTEGESKICKDVYCHGTIIFAGGNEETERKPEQLVSGKRFEPQTSRTEAQVSTTTTQTFVFNEKPLLSIDFVSVNTWQLKVLTIPKAGKIT